jgi:predicted component of type VI protein secretion system
MHFKLGRVGLGETQVMGFNATFNNISAILWRSVLLVEETGVPIENHRPVASH